MVQGDNDFLLFLAIGPFLVDIVCFLSAFCLSFIYHTCPLFSIHPIRTEAGLTQAVLDDKVEVGRSMLTQIERGTKTLSLPLTGNISAELFCARLGLLRLNAICPTAKHLF